MDIFVIIGIILVAAIIGFVFFMNKKKKGGGPKSPSDQSMPQQPGTPSQNAPSQTQQSNTNTPQ